MPPRKVVVPKPSKQPKQTFLGGGLEPPKFMPTLYEWLFSKGEEFNRWYVKSSGEKEFYTVPQDKVLYLTDFVWLFVSFGTGVGNGYGQFWIKNFANQPMSWQIELDLTIIGDRTIPVNFSTPLKLIEGAKIALATNDANCRSYVFLHGFLVNNKDIPTL